MKPFILPVPPLDKDGKIRLTPDELDSLIDKAYNAGYSDGSKNRSGSGLGYPYYPSITPCSPGAPESVPTPYITWTCESHSKPNDTASTFTQSVVNWSEEVKKSM